LRFGPAALARHGHPLGSRLDPREGFILASYNVGAMSEMTEAADVKLLYLPSHGPGSNPIKMDFSKLKASLQKAASTPKPISRMLSD